MIKRSQLYSKLKKFHLDDMEPEEFCLSVQTDIKMGRDNMADRDAMTVCLLVLPEMKLISEDMMRVLRVFSRLGIILFIG